VLTNLPLDPHADMTPPGDPMTTWASMSAFEAREDLKKYGDNALLLYALELRHGIGDIHAIAADALTDGADDKKCDLVYIDRDTRTAVIAQGYAAKRPKKEAPANKASDLNTAAAWLLSAAVSTIPDQIRSAAKDLRAAIKDKDIEVLEFWYVHNCSVSKNVEKELSTVQAAARTKIDAKFPGANCHEVRATEIGLETLEEWYKTTRTAILVGDTFTVAVPGGCRHSGYTTYTRSTALVSSPQTCATTLGAGRAIRISITASRTPPLRNQATFGRSTTELLHL
jgi:hypothetical protein